MDANDTSEVSAELAVAGDAVRYHTWVDAMVAMLRWNPMLLLWSIVLGVPIIIGVVRFSMTTARKRRRRATAA